MSDFSREREDAQLRKSDDTPDEKVRILQDNLVFVNALPADASSREVPSAPRSSSRKRPTSAGTDPSASSS
jgi:hypothetical protein